MRYLGIDFGTKQIGLALGESVSRVVTPLRTIKNTSREIACSQLVAIIREYGIDAVVIGLPLNDDGSESDTSRQVRNIQSKLTHMAGCPVYFEDERYSSHSAEILLRERGISSKKQKQLVDQMAAVVILEAFLDKEVQ